MNSSSQLCYLLISFHWVLVIIRANKIEGLTEHIGGLSKPRKHAHLERKALRDAKSVTWLCSLTILLV